MTFPGYGPMDPRLPQAPRAKNPPVTPQAHGILPPATAKAAAVARSQPYFIYFMPARAKPAAGMSTSEKKLTKATAL